MCSFLIEERYYEKFRRYKEAQKRALKCQHHYPEMIYMHVLIYVCNVLYAIILYITIHIYVFHKFDILHKTIYTFIFYIIANQNTFYVKISCCIIFSIPLFLIFCHPIIDLLFVRYLSASHFFRKCT